MTIKAFNSQINMNFAFFKLNELQQKTEYTQDVINPLLAETIFPVMPNLKEN